MEDIMSKTVEDCGKVTALVRAIDELLDKLYPEEWQVETVNSIQYLAMVLEDQAKALQTDVLNIEH